jgi:hypothetical protein
VVKLRARHGCHRREKVASADATANPARRDFFVALAAHLNIDERAAALAKL